MLLIGIYSKWLFRTSRFISFNNDRCIQIIKHFHSNNLNHTNRPNQIHNYGNNTDVLKEPYDKHVTRRRLEAQRSVLVQVHSENSSSELNEYCSQFGKVSGMHHYTVSNSTHFILMEFDCVEAVKEVLKSCGHADRSHIIPTHSQMLWFRASSKKKLSVNSSPVVVTLQTSPPPLLRSQLLEWLKHSESISDQILLLYQATRLDELGIRLRYFTAYQLEAAVSGLFPRAQVLLFGSSSNGFGRQGCDLDLVLQLDDRWEEVDASCRLMFQTKPATTARSQTQRHIDGLADLVQWFLPGCTDVRRILMARVPIVKFHQEFTDVECDLSLTNMTAVYMSELLYTYGAIDYRLRPLVFSIKRWAAEVGLTNPSPGRWITNFSLTLLVIFYLQQKQLLPSLDTLRKKASKSDQRISEDGVNCSFLRDVSKLSSSPNSSSLESLLVGFFEYYATFDFAINGISLNAGSPVKKRDHSALYITNPLETHLNVSQNVSLEEMERLKIEFRSAAWELESTTEDETGARPSDWGLLKLCKENKFLDKARHLDQYFFTSKRRTSHRLMPISKIFEEEPDQTDEKTKSSRSIEKTGV